MVPAPGMPRRAEAIALRGPASAEREARFAKAKPDYDRLCRLRPDSLWPIAVCLLSGTRVEKPTLSPRPLRDCLPRKPTYRTGIPHHLSL